MKRLAILTILLSTLIGCAVNPATGKRQLMLISEADEIELGRSNDQALTESLGVYDAPEIQAYVERLGKALAATSERPSLPWTFRVVDDPVVNAFALPGGYVYITRGILAHLNNEAQLASVLGHEIGHVTARHGANQLSKDQLTQLGFQATMAVSEDLRTYGQILQAGLGLLSLKYSRDDERQADDLGLRYLVRGGYDPRPMAGVYTVLGNVAQHEGAGRVPNLLSTHPAPDNRTGRINDGIAALDIDPEGLPVRRGEYMKYLDNMIYGINPREGFFRDQTFMHPDMRFRLDFPEGWQTLNQRSAVVGVSQGQDALVQVTLAQVSEPEDALKAFLSAQGIQGGEPWRDRIHGRSASSSEFTAATSGGTLRGLVAYIRLEGRTFRILGYTPAERWDTHGATLQQSVGSFDRLRDRKAVEVQPLRLRIVRGGSHRSLAQLGDAYNTPVSVETLALLNQISVDTPLEPERAYKLVVGEPLP